MILRSNMMSQPIVELPFTKKFHHNKEVYGVKENCKLINSNELCKNNQIVDITNTSCIPKIIKGINASCSSTQHKTPNIEEIKEGVLLINNLKANITGNCSTSNLQLNGTYIIKYQNCTLGINDLFYKSTELLLSSAIPQNYQTNWKDNSEYKQLSMKYLNELHINNTKTIKLIDIQTSINTYGSYIVYVIIIIGIILFYFILKNKNNNNPKINIINDIPMLKPTQRILTGRTM